LFAKLEVEGYQRMRYELTPDARDLGLDAALPAELEVGAQMGGFGRGERGSASLTHCENEGWSRDGAGQTGVDSGRA
jgi:hypothetical protein